MININVEDDWIRVVRLLKIRDKIAQGKATEEEKEYFIEMKPLLDEYEKSI